MKILVLNDFNGSAKKTPRTWGYNLIAKTTQAQPVSKDCLYCQVWSTVCHSAWCGVVDTNMHKTRLQSRAIQAACWMVFNYRRIHIFQTCLTTWLLGLPFADNSGVSFADMTLPKIFQNLHQQQVFVLGLNSSSKSMIFFWNNMGLVLYRITYSSMGQHVSNLGIATQYGPGWSILYKL